MLLSYGLTVFVYVLFRLYKYDVNDYCLRLYLHERHRERIRCVWQKPLLYGTKDRIGSIEYVALVMYCQASECTSGCEVSMAGKNVIDTCCSVEKSCACAMADVVFLVQV